MIAYIIYYNIYLILIYWIVQFMSSCITRKANYKYFNQYVNNI